MPELPTVEDLRKATSMAGIWAVRSLLQTLFVDRCMAQPDPAAFAREMLTREADAMDGVSAPAVGTVDAEMVKHLVVREIETLLQSVAREVALRVERGQPPTEGPVPPRAGGRESD